MRFLRSQLLNVLRHAHWILMCWCVVVVCNSIWLCRSKCVGDDPSKLMVSTQPKPTVLPHAHQVLEYGCCMILFLFGSGICVGNYSRKLGVSTRPKVTVLPQAYWILVCWCRPIVCYMTGCIAWCIGELLFVV